MYLTVISLVRDDANNIEAYKIIDIDTLSTKLVTREKLIEQISYIRNIKVEKGSLEGVNYSFQDLPYTTLSNPTHFENVDAYIAIPLENRKIRVVGERGASNNGTSVEEGESSSKTSIIYKDIEEVDLPLLQRSIRILNIAIDGRIEYEQRLQEPLINNRDKELGVEEFRKDMKSKGVKISLTKAYPDYSCYRLKILSKCTKLHIPLGVIEVEGIDNLDEAEELIISGTVRKISRANGNNLKTIKIKMIYFQKYEKLPSGLENKLRGEYNTLDANGLNTITVDYTNLPNTPSVENIYNNSEIMSLDTSNTSVASIKGSFTNTTIHNKSLSFKSVERVSYSFNNVHEIKEIDFNNEVIEIRESFNNKEGIVRVTGLLGVEQISAAFNDNSVRTHLDLTPLRKLSKIWASFNNNENLVEVRLPENLLSIGRSFGESKIMRLDLPSKIKTVRYSLGNMDTLISYPSTITKVTAQLLDGYPGMSGVCSSETKEPIHPIEFKGVVTELGGRALDNIRDLEKHKEWLKDVERVDGGVLKYNCKIEIFDSKYTPKLKVLPEGALSWANKLKYIILRRGVEEIEKNIIENCSSLVAIILEGDKEIPRNFIQSISTGRIVKLYVEEGTNLCRLKGNEAVKVIKVKNIEEAIDIEINGKTSSVQEQAKFNFMLNLGDEYKDLLEDRYVSNVGLLYGILSKLKEPVEGRPRLKLNTSKFHSIPIESLTVLNQQLEYTIKNYGNTEVTKETNLDIPTEEANEFISLSNIISELGENNDKYYTLEFIEKINKLDCINVQPIYNDSLNQIIKIDGLCKSSTPIGIIVIAIGNEIKYITGYSKYIEKSPTSGYLSSSMPIYGKTYAIKGKTVIDDLKDRGGLLRNTIQACEFPSKYLGDLEANILDTMRILGLKKVSSKAMTDRGYTGEALCLNLISGKLFKADIQLIKDSSRNITAMEVKEEYDSLDEVRDLVDYIGTYLIGSVNDYINQNNLKYLTYSDADLQDKLNNPTYTPLQTNPTFEDIVQYIINQSVTNSYEPLEKIREMHITKEFIERVIGDKGIYTLNKSITLKQLEKFKKLNDKLIDGKRYLEYKDMKKGVYYEALVEEGENLKGRIYEGVCGVKTYYNLFQKVIIQRIKSKEPLQPANIQWEEEYKISNKPVSSVDTHFIDLMSYTSRGIDYTLAMHITTLDTYLLATRYDKDDTNRIKIMRFKGYREGVKYFRDIERGKELNNVYHIVEDIYYYVREEESDVSKLRREIIRGLSSDYPVLLNYSTEAFYGAIATQPAAIK